MREPSLINCPKLWSRIFDLTHLKSNVSTANVNKFFCRSATQSTSTYEATPVPSTPSTTSATRRPTSTTRSTRKPPKPRKPSNEEAAIKSSFREKEVSFAESGKLHEKVITLEHYFLLIFLTRRLVLKVFCHGRSPMTWEYCAIAQYQGF